MSPPILYPVGTIISSNYPLVHVLNDKSKFCDHCFKESSSLKKCSGCNRMFYCDSSCQKLDWKGKHKLECSSANFAEFNIGKRFINRLNLAISDENSLHRKFYFRPSNQNVGGESKSFTLLDLCSQIGITSGSEKIESEVHHKLIQRYSRPILDDCGGTIGFGLYVAEACSTDYSCAPNAVPSFVGTRADLRAMTDIRVGQPITTGEDFYRMPRIERRAFLLNELEIDCHCEMCDEDWENDSDCEVYDKLKKQLEEFSEVADFYADLYRLQEYVILQKQLCVALKKRLKYHHPRLSVSLFGIFMFARKLVQRKLNIAVPEFDQLYPRVMKSFVKSMEITHDPSNQLLKIFHELSIQDMRQGANSSHFKMRLFDF